MKRGLMICASLAALWASACSGGGSSIQPPPPPPGPFSNESLNGQYAFSMTGSEIASSGLASSNLFTRVGSFSANGKGVITGGAEDINLVTGANEFNFTGGSYSVNGDGTGTLSLIDSSGTLTFSITLTSSSNGYIIAMPTDGLSTASGSFVKQDPTTFLVSGISGNYAFDFSGLDSTGQLPRSVVGQFFADSAGHISTGFADDNDGAVIVNGGDEAITGTYAADGLNPSDLTNFGRGVFTLDGIVGVFYIVGHNQVKFMERTSGGALAGDAFTQSAIPTTTAGISGGFVYVMGGSGGAGPLTRGGRFSTSGGALSAIQVDNNNAGTLLSLSATTGSYTIDPSGNGRGTITYNVPGQKNTFSYVFYLISPTQAVVQDQSIGIVADGSLLGQPSATISNTSLAGNYGVEWSGLSSTDVTADEEDLVGQAALSSGNLTGTIDLNEFASGKQFTGVATTGTLKLSTDPTQHNALTFNLATNPVNNGITAFAYVANNNTVLFMGTQSVRVIAGVLTPQTQ